MTSPSGEPGTAPLDRAAAGARRRRARSRGSARCASRCRAGPAILLPGNTRPGILRHADRARLVVRDRVAVRRAVRAEVVALDDAGEALADASCPVTSTFWPTSNMSTPTTPPALRFGELRRRSTRNSRSTLPASTPALAKWPASGLLTRVGAALAERDLHGRIAVGLRRLDLRDAVVRTRRARSPGWRRRRR